MQHISAPWRSEYIKSLERHSPESTNCFLCDAASASTDGERRERLVLRQSEHAVLLLNRYPYTSGHLLVAPSRHVARLSDLHEAEHLDLLRLTNLGIELLERVLNPQGFNVGINLGRAAGAGVPGHLHQHVVPRWAGDTNFISVVGEVRIMPHALMAMYDQLAAELGSRCAAG
jgi:ATP adenylyltransferase